MNCARECVVQRVRHICDSTHDVNVIECESGRARRVVTQSWCPNIGEHALFVPPGVRFDPDYEYLYFLATAVDSDNTVRAKTVAGVHSEGLLVPKLYEDTLDAIVASLPTRLAGVGYVCGWTAVKHFNRETGELVETLLHRIKFRPRASQKKHDRAREHVAFLGRTMQWPANTPVLYVENGWIVKRELTEPGEIFEFLDCKNGVVKPRAFGPLQTTCVGVPVTRELFEKYAWLRDPNVEDVKYGLDVTYHTIAHKSISNAARRTRRPRGELDVLLRSSAALVKRVADLDFPNLKSHVAYVDALVQSVHAAADVA